MARRRLTPPPVAADVPRAEHFDGAAAGPLKPKAFAPISHVAADASGAAALQEMSRALTQARETGRLVLDLGLDQIAADHLTRDRLPVEDEETARLRESLRLHGQRTPIEVTPVAGALPYGLISGWRRLTALKALHVETGEPRFATVQALVRRPEAAADAYVTMVEENEIRVGLSQYERARVAALATRRGVFETEKAALLALFGTASRAKRSRIRAFLDIFHALDGVLRFPAHLPERLGLKLVEALRAGQGAAITAALGHADPQSPEAELAALTAAMAQPRSARPAAAAESLRPGVMLEQTLHGRTLTLKFTGAAVTPDLAAEIRVLLLDMGRRD